MNVGIDGLLMVSNDETNLYTRRGNTPWTS